MDPSKVYRKIHAVINGLIWEINALASLCALGGLVLRHTIKLTRLNPYRMNRVEPIFELHNLLAQEGFYFLNFFGG